MLRCLLKIGLLLLMLFSSVLSVAAKEAVVARVSGVPITEYEINREINKVMPFKVSFHSKMPKQKMETIREEVVSGLIERAHKIRYAEEQGITVSSELQGRALAQIRNKFPTDEDFIAAVGEETLEGLKASIYREYVAQEAEKQAVDSKVSVSEQMLQQEYDENPDSYVMPMQFKASHILIKVDPAATKEQKQELQIKAEALQVRAKNGEDFYNLAYYNSDDRTRYVGGDLGFFHEGQTAKPFEDALKEMKIGEISDLVRTRWGFHIIKLTQKNPPRHFAFDEIKDKIRQRLEKEQRAVVYDQWLTDLKNRYQVERVRD